MPKQSNTISYRETARASARSAARSSVRTASTTRGGTARSSSTRGQSLVSATEGTQGRRLQIRTGSTQTAPSKQAKQNKQTRQGGLSGRSKQARQSAQITRTRQTTAAAQTKTVKLTKNAVQTKATKQTKASTQTKQSGRSKQEGRSKQQKQFEQALRTKTSVRQEVAEAKDRSKRKSAKKRAGALFLKHYGGASSSASEAETSRPALYKGEMGKSHKKASRAQGNPAHLMGVAAGFGSMLPDVSKLMSSRKTLTCLSLILCLVLAGAFVYPAAKLYYTTSREYAQLQAEYAAIEERNAVLQASVDSLSTDEGIEDVARTELGMVAEGDNAVQVYGLSASGEETSAYTKAVVAGSVEAPATWYSPLLDVIFGVS